MTQKGYKVFQDATLGYISVKNTYVKHLIDTFFMQREKNVSQVGTHPIYSGATNNRFSHSLGVYHIGTKIFESVKNSIRYLDTDEKNKPLIDLEGELALYEIFYNIACLLHDIGHAPFSHTLEYNFKNRYVDLNIDGENKSTTIEETVESLLDRYIDLKTINLEDRTYLEYAFTKQLEALENGNNNGHDLRSSPHEIMGAYQILTSKKIKDAISAVVDDEFEKVAKVTNVKKPRLNDILTFIARMITGCAYDIRLIINNRKSKSSKDIKKLKEKYSLRNCIIALLNGNIDADMLDYLNRNAHYAGYASNNIDLNRLCSAIQIYYDDRENLFTNCIYKSALSCLDGVLQARNYEPKWLYSHHKVVYSNDVLIKYIIKECSAQFCEFHQKDIELALFNCLFGATAKYKKIIDGKFAHLITNFHADYVKSSSPAISSKGSLTNYRNRLVKKLMRSKCDPLNKTDKIFKLSGKLLEFAYYVFTNIENQLKTCSSPITEIKNQFDAADSFFTTVNHLVVAEFKYAFANIILAPNTRLQHSDTFFIPSAFYKSTDGDIENLFKSLYIKICPIKNTKSMRIRQRLYIELLEEFQTRKYRQSLWKSYEEYRLFLEELIQDIPSLSFQRASELLISFIESFRNEHWIEFEDIQKTHRAFYSKKFRDTESIYVNCANGDEFDNVFGVIGDNMILRIYHGKYKNFDDLMVKFGKNQFRKYKTLNYVERPNDFYLPYIYYKSVDDIDVDSYRDQLLNELAITLKKFFLTKCKGGKTMDIEKITALNCTVIRDSVHGDIEVEPRFLPIIQCKAFQRLHRIKQLATANYVFPEAVHTRFAHSLGTFYVMKKMINHFCLIFDKLNIPYTEKDKDAILVAALLHDIGHGPLSHTFEGLAGVKSHEDWTRDIIKQDEELKKILTEWGDSFPDEVISCLNGSTNDPHSLQYVFSELISSNLDADRIDYLLRDSQNTGEKFGIFDIQKLISAMLLTEYDGKLCVALNHNALPAVEQFIIGRYNMYSMVYFAPYKLMSEELFRNICKTIVEQTGLCLSSADDKMREIGQNLQNLTIYKLFHDKVTVKDYLQMDDYSIMHEISDAIKQLSTFKFGKKYEYMLDSFLYRQGYSRKHILNDSLINYKKFESRMSKEPCYQNLQHSIIPIKKSFYAYRRDKGVRDKEILIIYDNGEVLPFSKASKYKYDFTNENNDYEKNEYLWETSFTAVYLNSDILDEELKEHYVENFEEERNKLIKIIDSYDMNKHTEIENKYFCSRATFETAKNKFSEKTFLPDYQISKSKSKDQCDIYYDTDNFDLANADYTLRCRKLSGKNIFTLKKPGSKGEGSAEAQFIRLEFEIESKSDNIKSANVLEFLKNNDLDDDIPAVNSARGRDFANLKPVIQIKNNRECYLVQNNPKDEFKCEVSFDHITYNAIGECSPKVMEDYQIEMELKDCNCLYRVTLNTFATQFCKEMKIDEKTQKATNSKYIHALDRLGLRSSSKKS